MAECASTTPFKTLTPDVIFIPNEIKILDCLHITHRRLEIQGESCQRQIGSRLIYLFTQWQRGGKGNSSPQYNDNQTHDSNSNVMCLKSTGQLSRRGTPALLITFQYGVDCHGVLSGVHHRRPAYSLRLPLLALTPIVLMGRLCDTF